MLQRQCLGWLGVLTRRLLDTRLTLFRVVPGAGMDSNKYRITQGFTATGLKMDKDCWGRPFGH
jgi:hypothetical protein